MSFGDNLQYLRKRDNLTQEELAEKLEISRQSVSKWESGVSFPEMDKVLQLCEMFHCNMNDLMQGEVSQADVRDFANYKGHMNDFAKKITAGITTILAGLTIMQFMTGAGIIEELATMVFMMFVVVGVLLLIVAGLQHDAFTKKNPKIDESIFSQDEQDEAQKKFIVGIASGVGLILIGIVLESGAEYLGTIYPISEDILGGIFFVFITVAVAILSYSGIQKAKYDVSSYNKEGNKIQKAQNGEETEDSRIGKACGIIMMLAAIVFLLLGFIGGYWHICWLSFVVGGILCGIVSVALSK